MGLSNGAVEDGGPGGRQQAELPVPASKARDAGPGEENMGENGAGGQEADGVQIFHGGLAELPAQNLQLPLAFPNMEAERNVFPPAHPARFQKGLPV